MAPHAEEQPAIGVVGNGESHEVNRGEAPHEPGLKKTIAQGKMMEFPRPPKFEANMVSMRASRVILPFETPCSPTASG